MEGPEWDAEAGMAVQGWEVGAENCLSRQKVELGEDQDKVASPQSLRHRYQISWHWPCCPVVHPMVVPGLEL